MSAAKQARSARAFTADESDETAETTAPSKGSTSRVEAFRQKSLYMPLENARTRRK